MFNVCPACGEYAVDKRVDPSGPYAVCPRCGHAHPFVMLPLFVVTGASGSGKSTVCLRLARSMPECVVLESDILWCPAFDAPEDGYAAYRDLWLRLAKNVGQAGRPVVLCGTVVPEQFEDRPERRYLSTIHYLALVCDGDALRTRLLSRPRWRESATEEYVRRHVAFDRWLRDHAAHTDPPMALLDTSDLDVGATVEAVRRWVLERLASAPPGGGPVLPATAVAEEPSRAEASGVLQELGLVDRLRRHGRAEVAGSVALDLLVKRDIDVHLLTEGDLHAVAHDVYRYLLDREGVREVRITDYRDRGSLKLAVDRYRGSSGDWKIDVWITNRADTVRFEETARLAEALTPEQRRAILEIKRHYHARGELLGGLSTRIYEAALHGGVRSVEGFEKWQEQG